MSHSEGDPGIKVKAATADKTKEKAKKEEKRLKRTNMGEDNPGESMRKEGCVSYATEMPKGSGMGSKMCNRSSNTVTSKNLLIIYYYYGVKLFKINFFFVER